MSTDQTAPGRKDEKSGPKVRIGVENVRCSVDQDGISNGLEAEQGWIMCELEEEQGWSRDRS
jgi:hypothetical protein